MSIPQGLLTFQRSCILVYFQSICETKKWFSQVPMASIYKILYISLYNENAMTPKLQVIFNLSGSVDFLLVTTFLVQLLGLKLGKCMVPMMGSAYDVIGYIDYQDNPIELETKK